jgi:hypothetical protein
MATLDIFKAAQVAYLRCHAVFCCPVFVFVFVLVLELLSLLRIIGIRTRDMTIDSLIIPFITFVSSLATNMYRLE